MAHSALRSALATSAFIITVAGGSAARAAPDAKDMKATVDSAVANGPNDRALKSTSVPDFQLLATSDDKVASMAVSTQLSGGGSGDRLSYSQFSLKASTKLDGNGGPTRLLGLKGFSGGTDIALGFTLFTGKVTDPGEEQDPAVEAARPECERQNPGNTAQCDPEDPSFPGSARFLELYGRKDFRAHMDKIFTHPIYFLGVEATGNQDNFDYVDRAKVAPATVSKFSYKGTIFGGVLLPKRVASISASLTYMKKYEAGSAITACQPANAAQCVSGADLPTATKDLLGSVEGRYAFGFADGGPARFALAPELTYDFNKEAFSADVPLYFMGDGTGKLRGGVRAVYLNEKKLGGGRRDGVTLSLFVGVPFSIFK